MVTGLDILASVYEHIHTERGRCAQAFDDIFVYGAMQNVYRSYYQTKYVYTFAAPGWRTLMNDFAGGPEGEYFRYGAKPVPTKEVDCGWFPCLSLHSQALRCAALSYSQNCWNKTIYKGLSQTAHVFYGVLQRGPRFTTLRRVMLWRLRSGDIKCELSSGLDSHRPVFDCRKVVCTDESRIL